LLLDHNVPVLFSIPLSYLLLAVYDNVGNSSFLNRSSYDTFLIPGICLRVQKEKDIGVTIDSELTFESHMCEKVNKATSIFGALRRAFIDT
jgi:hypothetical protein